MSETILKVKMLGGFSLQYEGKEIVLDRNAVSKTVQLMQIIMENAREGISKGSLIDALYGRDDEVENKNGSLNNTIFRLRKQLKAAGLPESRYINIKNGICKWDETIPLEVDVELFVNAVDRSREEEREEKREELLSLACRLYRGEFLPTMIGESWIAERNAFYREQYVTCLQELLEQYKREKKFEKIYRLASSAAEIYPYDDWQVWQIDSLIELRRFKEAMSVYEKSTKMMFEKMNVEPSQEMLERAAMMGEKISQASGAIGDIKRRLDELDKMEGAYFCSFPSFVDAYHVLARMMERVGMSVYIMLCTLRSARGRAEDENGRLEDASQTLRRMIQETLRRGDFFTRYNTAQYLIMLPEITQENCKVVSERIDASFRAAMNGKDFLVDYYVASIAEFYPEETKNRKINSRK